VAALVTTVDVVVPVRDEAHVLERSIDRLRSFLERHAGYEWTITIAENGSTDGTRDVARRLCAVDARLRFLSLDLPGRGRALRQAWTTSAAGVVCYVDVDHSTSLDDLPRLIDPVAVGSCDLAVASRRLPASRVRRSWRRQVISDGYNILLRLMLDVRFSDAQTGCKALSRRAVTELLDDIVDQSWFLDTELLVLAERRGYRILDVPVTWTEDDDSRVRIIPTAIEDVRGMFRLWRTHGRRNRGARA
jgi:glycosyltransferase involved in cell wall biosynthesis